MEDEQGNLGSRFWLPIFGLIVAGGIGAFLLFLLVDGLWYRYGALGALFFLMGGLLLFGWLYDRRQTRRRANIEY
jgi:Flp pilus assembly protein TadB